MHLVIDGFGCDYQQVSDPEYIRRFLDSYPDAIHMTKITTPAVYSYRGPQPLDWGVSGFVIIAESHISVHTFPDRSHINIDVFSCMDFDTEKALEEIRQVFTMSEVRTWTMERGLEHMDPATARQVVESDRQTLSQRL
jgi:S-adenosylmethionine decarboxylase